MPHQRQRGHLPLCDVGENNPNEVVVYTDTHKVLVRAVGRRAIFDMAAKRSYWEGENTGLPAGSRLPAEGDLASPSSLQDEPRPPISSEGLDWDEEGVPGSTRFGGRSRHLTHAAVGGGYRVGMVLEAPAPGMRLAPKHYHLLEEEHALILEGQVTLLVGSERHDMSAGDYVCFPAGLQIGHSFMNSGKGPCSYLMIGERNPDDVRVYPDSNKIAVQALRGREAIFDMTQVKGYWDGEEGN
ncbi:MAG: cupin domain-containing protein [Gammaproteobacteria bacterium]|nr:cupin domain-containing protein [Gammaproteobacteria bacterium]